MCISTSASAQGLPKKVKGVVKAISEKKLTRPNKGPRPQVVFDPNSSLKDQGKRITIDPSHQKQNKYMEETHQRPTNNLMDQDLSPEKVSYLREKMAKMLNKPRELKDVTDPWWLNHIGGLIEEQIYKLGIYRLQIDFELEKDTVGYILNICDYRYDAA